MMMRSLTKHFDSNRNVGRHDGQHQNSNVPQCSDDDSTPFLASNVGFGSQVSPFGIQTVKCTTRMKGNEKKKC